MKRWSSGFTNMARFLSDDARNLALFERSSSCKAFGSPKLAARISAALEHRSLLTNESSGMKKSQSSPQSKSPSALIDGRIQELGDWRGKLLGRLRALIKAVDPEVVEEWKWRGVPVWSHHGMICTGETYKEVVKMTFAKGALLDDPARLFNSSLQGNIRRAIDFREGEKLNERALKTLLREAVALNTAKKKQPRPAPKARSKPAAAEGARRTAKIRRRGN
jgi:hypothetical protein